MEICRPLETSSRTDGHPPSYPRKVKKPLIEKKRRDRINRSLSNLKALLLENIRRNGGTQTSKLDKADILEMTVNHLRSKSPNVIMSSTLHYQAGYRECAKIAARYLNPARTTSNSHVTASHDKYLFPSIKTDDIKTKIPTFTVPLIDEHNNTPIVRTEPIRIQIPHTFCSTPTPSLNRQKMSETLLIPINGTPHKLHGIHHPLSPFGRQDMATSPASDKSLNSSSESTSPDSVFNAMDDVTPTLSTSVDVWRPW